MILENTISKIMGTQYLTMWRNQIMINMTWDILYGANSDVEPKGFI